MLPRIKEIKPMSDFRFYVEFDDGKIDLPSDTIYEYGKTV